MEIGVGQYSAVENEMSRRRYACLLAIVRSRFLDYAYDTNNGIDKWCTTVFLFLLDYLGGLGAEEFAALSRM